MKIKGLLFVLVVLVLLTLTTCKNQVNLFAPYKEIPVVYGLLSTSDPVHYIRIQKGYQSNGNAYLAGGILDSIYYPDILKVTLSALPNGPSYLMHRIVINYNPANPLSKDSGTFAYGENILYADSHVLNPNLTYQLQIIDTTSRDTITAQTTLVQPFQINTPYYVPGQPPFGSQIQLSNINPEVIDWQQAVNGDIYDITVQFYFYQFNGNSPAQDDSITLNLLSSYLPSSSGGTLQYSFLANVLFNSLAEQLTASTNIHREFNKTKGMTFTFSAGGNALANYLNSGLAQSSTLASEQTLPPYTNIPGGVGIFSSRLVEVVDSVQLSEDAIDSLACNSSTQTLNFFDHNGSLCY